jgi:DNA-binding NarL/FixJ family response regulator
MKILIVDDDALIRDGLAMILETEDDMEIVGTASNGQEAVNLCGKTQPDVVLMDIRMPVMDGVQATKNIKEQFRAVRVLLLTTFKDSDYIKSAINYGADGYVLKSCGADRLVDSIRAVYGGNVVLEKEIASALTKLMPKAEKLTPEELGITKKEYEIMELVGRGLSNKEIAAQLYISEGTLRNNISVLLEKLQLRDRTQLAIFYIRRLEK